MAVRDVYCDCTTLVGLAPSYNCHPRSYKASVIDLSKLHVSAKPVGSYSAGKIKIISVAKRNDRAASIPQIKSLSQEQLR